VSNTSPHLDETRLRLPRFAGGTPVRLRDGQVWSLATPRVVTRTWAGPNGPVLLPAWTLGDPALDRELERALVTTPDDAGMTRDRHFRAVVAAAAACLLMANYDLTAARCHGLLVPGPGDDPVDALGLMTAVLDVAYGRPHRAMLAALARLPYRDAGEYAAVRPESN
jgi:hypothetical protein